MRVLLFRADSQAAGVRGMKKLTGEMPADIRSTICQGLAQLEGELYADLEAAAKRKDLRAADSAVEELKWSIGSQAGGTCSAVKRTPAKTVASAPAKRPKGKHVIN